MMQLPSVGQRFQGFDVERVLGEGGFAIAYLAHRDGSPVAIKVLKPESGREYHPETAARFAREVALASRLDHPNTVRMLDHGTTSDGLLYMVLEYVEGRDLSKILAEQGTLSEAQVRDVLTQALRGLQAAHEVGLVHRDIKPDNIRVSGERSGRWQIKVLDFGVAKPLEAEAFASITKTGGLVGTPRYMSPEQLRFHKLTPATDIFSLGVVAFEMLMGAGAMHGWRLSEQIDRVLDDAAMSVDVSVSRELRDVIAAMVANDVARRLPSAAATLEALRSGPIRLGESGQAHPSRGAISEMSTPRLGRRATISLLVASSLILVGLVLLLTRGPDEPARPQGRVRGDVIQLLNMPQPPPPSPPPVPVGPIDPIVIEAAGFRVAAAHDAGADFAGRPSGCGLEPGRSTFDSDFRADGQSLSGEIRSSTFDAKLHVPGSYEPDRPHPLILLLHAEDERPTKVLRESGLTEIAEAHGVILLAPNDPNVAPWRDLSDVRGVRDAYFAVAAKLCVDPHRVFAFGNGSGGRAIERLGCQMPWLRAIGTNSYRHREDRPTCDIPFPYIHIVGKQDGLLAIDGGRHCIITSEVVPPLTWVEEQWRTRNQCEDGSTPWYRYKQSECQQWSCDSSLVVCQIEGGAGWNTVTRDIRSPCNINDPAPDFPFAQVIWKFFSEAAVQDRAKP